MSIYGVSGEVVKLPTRFAAEINGAALARNFPPCFLGAIRERETGDRADAATVISGDGGHGAYQLTSSYPDNWQDVTASGIYAIDHFLMPAIQYWHGLHLFNGDTLVLLVAATYNEGLGAAIKWHEAGDVDRGTTNEYGHGVLAIFKRLAAMPRPT